MAGLAPARWQPCRLLLPALRTKALIAEHLGHQGGAHVGHGRAIQTWLLRAVRECVAWERGRHDGKGIAGVAAKARRIGQQGHQFMEFPDRTWPTMQQQQRHGVRPNAGLMEKVQGNATERHGIVAEGIELRLMRAPVVLRPPVRDGNSLRYVRSVPYCHPAPGISSGQRTRAKRSRRSVNTASSMCTVHGVGGTNASWLARVGERGKAGGSWSMPSGWRGKGTTARTAEVLSGP